MSFWNYLGLACLFDFLFGKKKQSHATNYTDDYYPHVRDAELNERYDSLSERINELESRLDNIGYDSDLYDELEDEIDLLHDELDEIESDLDYYDEY